MERLTSEELNCYVKLAKHRGVLVGLNSYDSVGMIPLDRKVNYKKVVNKLSFIISRVYRDLGEEFTTLTLAMHTCWIKCQ